MLAALALMLVALADCHGLLGIDVDALSLGDADADGPQLASCDWSSGFETPEPVTSLNTIEWEWEARLSPDELTAYISRAPPSRSRLAPPTRLALHEGQWTSMMQSAVGQTFTEKNVLK